MAPRQPENGVPCEGECPTAPPRQPERKRRFQLIKLEERIAPGGHHTQCFRCCGSAQTSRF
jgi:hypothetical protein